MVPAGGVAAVHRDVVVAVAVHRAGGGASGDLEARVAGGGGAAVAENAAVTESEK
eukprot:COSAG02_NODE_481_length_21461_cov_43.885597_21_plen_55_part_00